MDSLTIRSGITNQSHHLEPCSTAPLRGTPRVDRINYWRTRTTYSEDGEIHERDEYTTKWKREWNKTIHIRWHNASDRNEIIKNMRSRRKKSQHC
ncbi:hypothetical protein EV363DRAFT_1433680 [Boletus edulis]|nr:hypothetical protein EV363DRAFT_1433680 [Boletus edulis]